MKSFPPSIHPCLAPPVGEVVEIPEFWRLLPPMTCDGCNITLIYQAEPPTSYGRARGVCERCAADR